MLSSGYFRQNNGPALVCLTRIEFISRNVTSFLITKRPPSSYLLVVFELGLGCPPCLWPHHLRRLHHRELKEHEFCGGFVSEDCF